MIRTEQDVSDQAAVQECAGGNGEALEDLYRRHGGSCLALARSVLVDAHHAEDAVQDAYLELWRTAARFDGSRSTVRQWLMMLTHRRAVDRVRVEQRRRTDALASEPDRIDPAAGPEVQALTAVLRESARSALSALSLPKREALVLAYWGGYTQSEIARLTATPVGTVKSRMCSGMRELRITLESAVAPGPERVDASR